MRECHRFLQQIDDTLTGRCAPAATAWMTAHAAGCARCRAEAAAARAAQTAMQQEIERAQALAANSPEPFLAALHARIADPNPSLGWNRANPGSAPSEGGRLRRWPRSSWRCWECLSSPGERGEKFAGWRSMRRCSSVPMRARLWDRSRFFLRRDSPPRIDAYRVRNREKSLPECGHRPLFRVGRKADCIRTPAMVRARSQCAPPLPPMTSLS
jgi:hypothetical protein